MIEKQVFIKSAEADPLVSALLDADGGLTKVAGKPLISGWDTEEEIRSFIKTLTSEDRAKNCYVLVIGLGAGEYYGSNINGDFFPWASLAHDGDDYGHKTFLRAHVYTHHKNKDPDHSIGKIVRSMLNDRMKRVELILELNREKARQEGSDYVISQIESGAQLDVSMGCKVDYDRCSYCGHLSKTVKDYCVHLSPPLELRDKYGRNRIMPDGKKIFMYNDRPRFFDMSFVFIGADKIAKSLAKIASTERGVCLGPVCEVPMEKNAGVLNFFKSLQERLFKKKRFEGSPSQTPRPEVPKRFLGVHDGYKVHLVDGRVVKKIHAGNTGEDFDGWGTSTYHPFVPKDEVWIEKRQLPEKDHIVQLAKLEHAMEDRDFTEVRETAKKTLTTPGPLPKPKKTIRHAGINIHFVDGAHVRKHFDPHFVLGGHNYVYNYVPKGEIWVDYKQHPGDLGRTIAHEVDEYRWMGKGEDYETAHNKSLVTENRPFYSRSLVTFKRKVLPKVASCSCEDDMDKLASVFKNSAQKLGEIIKDVPAGAFSGTILPSLESSEPSMPRGVLDSLSEFPLRKVLSGLTGAGVVAKPAEFQRIVLIRMGNRDLADRLDDNNLVFRPCRGMMDSPIADNMLDHVKDVIPRLLDYAKDRSAFGGPLNIRIVISKCNNPLPTDSFSDNPLLDKISAAYNGYRRNVLMKMATAARTIQSDPRLRDIVMGHGLHSLFDKTTSVPELTLDTVKYLMGAYMADRGLLTEPAIAGAVLAHNEGLLRV